MSDTAVDTITQPATRHKRKKNQRQSRHKPKSRRQGKRSSGRQPRGKLPRRATVKPTTSKGEETEFFSAARPFAEHLSCVQQQGVQRYLDLFAAHAAGGGVTTVVKARSLAVLWVAKEYTSFHNMLHSPDTTPAEVFAFVKLLDSPRRARQARRKLSRAGCQGCRADRLVRRWTQLQHLENSMPKGVSLSGSLARCIRRWVRTLPAETLEFSAIHFDLAPWKELADTTHLKPTDFQLDFFLPLVFGAPAPPESFVAAVRNLSAANLVETLTAHPRLADCYSEVRRRLGRVGQLPTDTKAKLATALPIEDLLWHFEELHCDAATQTLSRRLDSGEPIGQRQASKGSGGTASRMNYGKLMERVLMLRRIGAPCWRRLLETAEQRLVELKGEAGSRGDAMEMTSTKPSRWANEGVGDEVVVLGDCSHSMSVAVEGAAIVASLLSVVLHADLSFFCTHALRPATQPVTAKDALHVADAVRCQGGTCPAAGLDAALAAGRRPRVVVVVTDEEENEPMPTLGGRETWFAERFKEYAKENPGARALFISYLRYEGDRGDMTRDMQSLSLPVRQLRMNPRRPDLSKFDRVLSVARSMLSEPPTAPTPATTPPPLTPRTPTRGDSTMTAAAAASALEAEWVQVDMAA